MVDCVDQLVEYIDYVLNTKRKRHLVGGFLMSLSLLFGGLSVTIFTLEDGDETNSDSKGDCDYE